VKLGLVSVAAVVLLGCGAAHTDLPDAKSEPDAGLDDVTFGADAPTMCEPADASAYTPTTMHSPNPPNAGKCTLQQAADYAACEGGDTSKCMEFGVGQPAQNCGACIETQYTDPTWGVVVFNDSIGTVNVEGCVDDALNQVSDEQANGGKDSCGDLLYASYNCQDAVCGTCVGDDLVTCDETAIATQCEAEDKAVEVSSSPCHELFTCTNGLCVLSDAAPPAALNCYPDPSITDPVAQRADFLTRIVEYMCGSGT
jgi:hypothetical protein